MHARSSFGLSFQLRVNTFDIVDLLRHRCFGVPQARTSGARRAEEKHVWLPDLCSTSVTGFFPVALVAEL